jgi:uncharacterized membrane protein
MLSLSSVLKINAISSGLTGLLLVSFHQVVAGIFEVTITTPFLAAGIFLVVFALFVFALSMQIPIKSKAVMTIVALDTTWVAASLMVIVLFHSSISLVGNMVIAGVALWVALMAYLQVKGVRSGNSGAVNWSN